MGALRVFGAGRIGKIEHKELEGGASFCSFTLAFTEQGYKTSKGKEIPEKTSWYNCIAWSGLGDVIYKFFGQGDQIILTDAIMQQDTYQDAEGKNKHSDKIVVNGFEFGAKKKGAETTTQAASQSYTPQENQSLNPADAPDDLPF